MVVQGLIRDHQEFMEGVKVRDEKHERKERQRTEKILARMDDTRGARIAPNL